ncbi:MAG: oligosaccharide flippase family protein [Pirellulales bacterium]
MTLAKTATRIGKLSTIYLIGSFAPQLVNMIVLPIYTDYLSQEQMGIFNLASRVAMPLGTLIQLGALAGLKSWYFRTDEHLRPQLVRSMQLSQFAVNLAVTLVLALVGVFVVDEILPGLPLSSTALYALWLLILAYVFGDASMRLASMVARLCEHAKTAIALSLSRYVIQTVVGLVIVYWLAARGLDDWQGFGRQVAASVAALAAAVVAARLVWKYGGGRFDLGMAKQTLRTGVNFVPHQLSDGLMLTANAWMVNGLFSTAALGVYGVAIAFAQLIQMPLINFGDAAYPTLSRLMREGGQENRRQQTRIYTLTLLIVIFALLGQQIFSTVAIRVLTNPSYHEAASVVSILIFAWAFQGFYSIVSQPVFFFGGGLWLSTATITSIVVSAGIGMWAIPVYGMYGAAWSMVAGFVVKFIVAAAASTYLYPLPWELTKIGRALACAGLIVWLDLTFVDGWLSVVKNIERPGSFFERVEWVNLITVVGAKLLLLVGMIVLLWITRVVTTREFRIVADAVRGKMRSWRRR